MTQITSCVTKYVYLYSLTQTVKGFDLNEQQYFHVKHHLIGSTVCLVSDHRTGILNFSGAVSK